MNKIIEEQLKKIQIATVIQDAENKNIYKIPKYCKPTYTIGKCYIVKLDKNIINNTTSILATNWNSGRAPKAEYYKIYINNIVGKMIKVDGLEYNYINKCDKTQIFSGWLDINDLTQLEIIEL